MYIVYEFDLIRYIYELDWIKSAKMDPCPTLAWHRRTTVSAATYNK